MAQEHLDVDESPLLIENWAAYTSVELWEAWRAQFASDDEAIISAVWLANRLVKEVPTSLRRKFYSIKDACIRRYGHSGRLEHADEYFCSKCDGEGVVSGALCIQCGGKGKYHLNLYVHEFVVAGKLYRFHSYVAPKSAITTPLEHTPFVGIEEIIRPLPLAGLIRILSYVAAVEWGMHIVNGRYVS